MSHFRLVLLDPPVRSGQSFISRGQETDDIAHVLQKKSQGGVVKVELEWDPVPSQVVNRSSDLRIRGEQSRRCRLWQ